MALYPLIRAALVAGLLALSSCSRPLVQPKPVEAQQIEQGPGDVDPGSFEVEPTPIPTPTASVSPTPVVVTQATPAPEVTPPPAPGAIKVMIAAPPRPLITNAGRALIYEYETGGRAGYKPRPEWPGLHSGATVGIGYDCGYNSTNAILSDWQALPTPQPKRLAATSGKTGQTAKALVPGLQDIYIKWDVSESVFDRVTLSSFFSQAKRAFPGFDDLRPNAQAALVSLVYNRGPGMSGANRSEMRVIRTLVPKQDYPGIAKQLRVMVRVWTGTSVEKGLTRRRYAEAKLVETP